ncbi:zinc ribbon domain-containing protein [Methylotetracoccus oryzae]|uniref:zinc ribbon domain-containing protein n=1 Tax=Methylotetracoccus oryzae TaxID=1919059 RepID=UPI0013A5AD2E|nr:zinc ribbon domain-containing protein [Methylotetracoccus oryzae]
MALIACPECGAEISDKAVECPKCGGASGAPSKGGRRLIAGIGGKFQAVGILLLAAGVIATVIGNWWGPAVLLPGIVLLMMGRMT